MKRLFIIATLFGALLFSEGVSAQNQPKAQVDRETVGFTVQVNNTRVVVQNVAPRTSIQIYSILGVKLKDYKMPANGDDLQFDLPKGCYILKTDEFVRKIAIK
ncbi:MAG: hypothetical protein PHV20_03900 [Bacteroidales bacterium]|nr:hypothetical protein [Bacteroidales bacterium]